MGAGTFRRGETGRQTAKQHYMNKSRYIAGYNTKPAKPIANGSVSNRKFTHSTNKIN